MRQNRSRKDPTVRDFIFGLMRLLVGRSVEQPHQVFLLGYEKWLIRCAARSFQPDGVVPLIIRRTGGYKSLMLLQAHPTYDRETSNPQMPKRYFPGDALSAFTINIVKGIA